VTISFTLKAWHLVVLGFVVGGALSAAAVLAATSGSSEEPGGTEGVEAAVLGTIEAAPTEVPPAPIAEPPPEPEPEPLPDRFNCSEIRGTDYRSAAERLWFIDNCRIVSAPIPAPQQAVNAMCPGGALVGGPGSGTATVEQLRVAGAIAFYDSWGGWTDWIVPGPSAPGNHGLENGVYYPIATGLQRGCYFGPIRMTALCADGYEVRIGVISIGGTCNGHGGVAFWVDRSGVRLPSTSAPVSPAVVPGSTSPGGSGSPPAASSGSSGGVSTVGGSPIGQSGLSECPAGFSCIPNFPNGQGTVVMCTDGQLSQSGATQGACSGHGGVRR
jgi:hypothetical protein